MPDISLPAADVWPAYATTLLVAFDSWENDIAAGNVWSYYFPEPHAFHSLDQLLFAMEEIMNAAGYPESWFTVRPWGSAASHPEKDHVPFYASDSLQNVQGSFCTLSVRVRSRQHATMQGDLLYGGSLLCFRSALELLYLLRQALETRSKELGTNQSNG